MRRYDGATSIATVGGLGRAHWAPGTWGSVVGLLFGVVMVRAFSPSIRGALLAATFVLGSLICTSAERQLGRHDPPSVILDEVWGMCAICVVLPVVIGSWLLLVAFLLFRAFDIIKPPPLKRLARLPAGWGIMADDLGAALYAILALGILRHVIPW